MLTSSWPISLRIVSMSARRACRISEFERRSGMMSGARSAPASGVGAAPRTAGAGAGPGAAGGAGAQRRARDARAPAPRTRRREELRENRGQLGRVRVLDRHDLQLFPPHLDVDGAHDVEEPAHVRRRVRDDEDVGLAVRDEVAAGGDERAQDRAEIVHRADTGGARSA